LLQSYEIPLVIHYDNEFRQTTTRVQSVDHNHLTQLSIHSLDQG